MRVSDPFLRTTALYQPFVHVIIRERLPSRPLIYEWSDVDGKEYSNHTTENYNARAASGISPVRTYADSYSSV